MPTVGLDEKVSHADLAAFAVSRVNLNSADVEDYRAQVNRLREKLASYIASHDAYDLVKMLQSGSVAKGTALRTINDMDVAVYVEAGTAPTAESQLLYWLEERLRDAYGGLLRPDQFSVQHHCVTISFRGTGLDVDVVPVLYEGEADDYGFLIVKGIGDRVRTSIKLHKQFIQTRKHSQPVHFAQVIRLVKWWIRQRKASDQDFRFKSFMAELILAKLADQGLDCSDYPHALQAFFAYVVRTELREPILFADFASGGKPPTNDGSPIRIYDPVNAENNVAKRYSHADRDRIAEAAADALDAITFARSASTKAVAIGQWREVFGAGFSA